MKIWSEDLDRILITNYAKTRKTFNDINEIKDSDDSGEWKLFQILKAGPPSRVLDYAHSGINKTKELDSDHHERNTSYFNSSI